MVLTGSLTFSIHGSLKKTVFFKSSFSQFLSEEIIGNDKLQENVVYIELKSIKSNSVFDWFGEREHVISCMHT